MLKSQIQKWGNRLAARIPKSLADMLDFDENSPVTLTVEDGKSIL